MIYQHRFVIARGGRLVKRHAAFQKEALGALEEHGSVLIGAWEVWIGPEAGCSVYQIRQFESLPCLGAASRTRTPNASLNDRYRSNLSPINDFVETAIVKRVEESPQLPTVWGTVCAWNAKRILRAAHPLLPTRHIGSASSPLNIPIAWLTNSWLSVDLHVTSANSLVVSDRKAQI